MLFCILILFNCVLYISTVVPNYIYSKPIRIALSIDEYSLKDVATVVNAAIESASEPAEVVFHIVACAKDIDAAQLLKKNIEMLLGGCFPGLAFEAVAFTLPTETGFYKQLAMLKEKSSHWNSQSGADMVRFFLSKLFPHVDRLLYIDNDVIISCCLEEIWSTPFEDKDVIGIALDDLRWAADTQFKRHYNGSHPLVISNMRRHQTDDYRRQHNGKELTQKEFADALPRYPNDGVILIDVQKYNAQHIFDIMNEVALANSRGENAVNLGTQQFTVLALYDKWKEITPRANLRHSPDMARGYLMWFYHNGFLHYAGSTKPRSLCLTTNADNAAGRLPYLRVMSYMAWAVSNYQVAHKCPQEDKLAYVKECVSHVLSAASIQDLFHVIWQIIQVSQEPALLYLHIGPLHGNLTINKYRDLLQSVQNPPHQQSNTRKSTLRKSQTLSAAQGDDDYHSDATSNAPSVEFNTSYWEKASAGFRLGFSGDDLVETIDRLVLHESAWSFRNFDHKSQRIESSKSILHTASSNLPTLVGANRKRDTPKRTFEAGLKHLCDAIGSRFKFRVPKNSRAVNSEASNNISASFIDASSLDLDETGIVAGIKCVGLLEELKAAGHKHWDVQAIVIDVNPPHNTKAPSSASQPVLTYGNSHTNTFSTKHTSVGVLLNLDLVFMRPKFIFVRIATVAIKMQHDTSIAKRHLQRSGYIVNEFIGPQCGTSWAVSHARHVTMIQYACVWGIRVNTFEFYKGLLL